MRLHPTFYVGRLKRYHSARVDKFEDPISQINWKGYVEEAIRLTNLSASHNPRGLHVRQYRVRWIRYPSEQDPAMIRYQ